VPEMRPKRLGDFVKRTPDRSMAGSSTSFKYTGRSRVFKSIKEMKRQVSFASILLK